MYGLQAYILLTCLICGVFTDLRTYKINNSIVLICLVTGFYFQIRQAAASGIGLALAGGFIPFMLLFPLFLFRMIGAGDVKMLAAVGANIGAAAILRCVAVSFFIAAVYSLIQILVYKNLKQRLQYLVQYTSAYLQTKQIVSYRQFDTEHKHLIHFSVPVLISVMLYLGGIY